MDSIKFMPYFRYILLTISNTENTRLLTGKLKHFVGSFIFD